MCPLCHETLARAGSLGLIKGFYWSILLIAGIPLLIMGIAGWAIWRQHRHRRRSLNTPHA